MDLQVDNLNGIHIINAALAVVGTVVWVWWGMKNNHRLGYIVMPIIYLLNVIGFCIAAVFHLLPPLTLNFWSSVIRMLGLINLVAIAVILVINGRRSWKSTTQRSL